MEMISISLSIISLAVSLYTFWVTWLHRGRLAMTTPTIVFFGHDHVPRITPKVFLRTLLYSTSTRGHVIEGMYVKLGHDNAERVFSFWGYGETEKLSPGSGLYVSRTGFAANHHFVMSIHEGSFEFNPGKYTIAVYARVAGRKETIKLTEFEISLSDELAASLSRHEGVLFERQISGQYEGHSR